MTDDTDTCGRILDAALELFSKGGYKATTTRSIAKKAEVNEVTVFRRFGSKEGLFLAVIDREAELVVEEADIRIPEPSDDLEKDLTEAGLQILPAMFRRAPFLRLVMVEAANRPAVWKHMAKAPAGIISSITGFFASAKKKGLLRQDVDPDVAALMFFSFFFRSMILRSFLGEDVFSKMDRRTINGFVRHFLYGIADGDDTT